MQAVKGGKKQGGNQVRGIVLLWPGAGWAVGDQRLLSTAIHRLPSLVPSGPALSIPKLGVTADRCPHDMCRGVPCPLPLSGRAACSSRGEDWHSLAEDYVKNLQVGRDKLFLKIARSGCADQPLPPVAGCSHGICLVKGQIKELATTCHSLPVYLFQALSESRAPASTFIFKYWPDLFPEITGLSTPGLGRAVLSPVLGTPRLLPQDPVPAGEVAALFAF